MLNIQPDHTLDTSIAIVIPAFNTEAYIQQAVDSVLEQTVLPDEIIIIDDGSTDGTADILAKHARNPLVRIIRTQNNGLGPARNLGRSLSKSQYVYFLDSDDWVVESFIERMKKEIVLNDDPDVILFSGKSFSDDGYRSSFSSVYQKTFSGVFKRGDQLITRLVACGISSSSACLYISKAELWSKNKLAYPPILHEDEAVLFPLLAFSQKTVVIEDVFFMRRVRAGSIMTSGITSQNADGILRVMNETVEFMTRNPGLITPDRDAWRHRVGQWAARYVYVCRSVKTSIAWPQVFAAIITARSFKHLIMVVVNSLPERCRSILRFVKRLVLPVRS